MLTLAIAITIAAQQGHDVNPGDGLKKLDGIVGSWTGTQNFNNNQKSDVTLVIQKAVSGRYLQENLTSQLPGRPAAETLHMLTFDPKTEEYRAWWFNDTAIGPTELAGKIDGAKLVLMSAPKPGGRGVPLRATYDWSHSGELHYHLEAQMNGSWTQLFETDYTHKSQMK